MPTRQIIEINQDLCNGCGQCETGCPEGALKVIDGKARLVGESLCDGLGACIGNCPLGAIKVTVRDAKEYDERTVIAGIAPQGEDVVVAHLRHLDHHGQDLYLRQAAGWMTEHGIPVPGEFAAWAVPAAAARAPGHPAAHGGMAPGRPSAAVPLHPGPAGLRQGGCPGSMSRLLERKPARAGADAQGARGAPGTEGACHDPSASGAAGISAGAAPGSAGATATGQPGDGAARSAFPERPSAGSSLSQWPIQLHLANPRSPHFSGADVLVAADCTAFAMGSFHADLLEGRKLLIACPKLDSGREIYVEKLAAIIGQARTVALAVMEVPCCSGLVKLALEARERSGRDLPLEALVVGMEGGFVTRKTY